MFPSNRRLIPSPPLLRFNGWQAWRAGPEKRPAKKKGDPVFTTSKFESTLWKTAMEKYHGTLDDEEAEEELEASGSGAGRSGPPWAAASSWSACVACQLGPSRVLLRFWGGTVVDRLRKLAEPYEPNRDRCLQCEGGDRG